MLRKTGVKTKLLLGTCKFSIGLGANLEQLASAVIMILLLLTPSKWYTKTSKII
jgi:hypothetical protein